MSERAILREAGAKKNMAQDLACGKRIYDKLMNQTRQQLALMNRRSMRRRGGKGAANQPFYVQFLNQQKFNLRRKQDAGSLASEKDPISALAESR